MSNRIGVSVSRGSVELVLLRRSSIARHESAIVPSGRSHAEVLSEILDRTHIRRFRRPSVTIAVGPAYSQLKRIEGLPAVRSPKMHARIVRENATSFFLSNGQSLLVTSVETRDDGTAWAASFDAALVHSLVAACRQHGLSDITTVPSVVAVAHLLTAGTHAFEEDGTSFDISSIEGDDRRSIRRARHQQPCLKLEAKWVEVLVGESTVFAAAFGAAVLGSRTSFAWQPPPDEVQARLMRRLALGAACFLLVASLSAALLSPAAHALHVGRRAAHVAASLRGARNTAAQVESELRRVSVELDQLAAFRNQRGRITRLLGDISDVLPESTAVVNLRLDEKDGSLIALAPHAGEVLSSLAPVEGIDAPRVIGSMTRETYGGARLERVSIRFRRRHQGR